MGAKNDPTGDRSQHLNNSATITLISLSLQPLLPRNYRKTTARSLKNEELKCKKVTSEIEECSRTKTHKRSSKNFELNRTYMFTIIASNFVREQLISITPL